MFCIESAFLLNIRVLQQWEYLWEEAVHCLGISIKIPGFSWFGEIFRAGYGRALQEGTESLDWLFCPLESFQVYMWKWYAAIKMQQKSVTFLLSMAEKKGLDMVSSDIFCNCKCAFTKCSSITYPFWYWWPSSFQW